ncbi:hypothetical protein GMLC_41860 [Geomonas limicola]|uniref:Clp protease ClpP n=2 Tax=Geomonas TaxID=2651583 RepID=A0A6V8MQ08_9BACT|nr:MULTISPECIES: ATP-dependent Clp protease proteolytic subunit [Geomonas]GFO62004.1 hypothetical protein GMST_43290 [Geomonas silvestris]GFO70607.1 hypothetical protein GMLC_41860 [Geomonas limicola]
MGFFSEYLASQLHQDPIRLLAERKLQLSRISALRGGRDILVYAGDINASDQPTQIGYEDLLPFGDQLANLNGKAIDIIVETPGGYAEVVEDIVRIVRNKYSDFAIIVPGWAKSAGTILAMAADEILMGPMSALGPIDAQMQWQGKRFSAGELLDGMTKIKDEVLAKGFLSQAYIPLLQGISPGELQRAENAQQFSQTLVKDWLVKFKFKNWHTHSSTGAPVTEEDKKQRAEDIAALLCDHAKWLTHGRSLKIEDLRKMKLEIADYSVNTALAEAIRRYHVLLQMTFQLGHFKIFETTSSQIVRSVQKNAPVFPALAPPGGQGSMAEIEVLCPACGTQAKLQASQPGTPLKPGNLNFPVENAFPCPKCGFMHDLAQVRAQLKTMGLGV